MIKKNLRDEIANLALDLEVKAEYAKKYALMPKSAGIDRKQALSEMAHYQVSAETLRRILSECPAAE